MGSARASREANSPVTVTKASPAPTAMKTSTTVRATPVKMVALALMVLTHTNVSAVMAGRGPTVKPT